MDVFEKIKYLSERVEQAKENLQDARQRAGSVSYVLTDMPKGGGNGQSKVERAVDGIMRCESTLAYLQMKLQAERASLANVLPKL